jgi:hypothetical protein
LQNNLEEGENMKYKMPALLLISVAACTPVVAQSATIRDWVGIWQAHVVGQPTGTLTLAADTGKLGGTIVLDMISSEGGAPHVIAREPHLLMDPHLNGNTLSFQVKMKMRDEETVQRRFTVTLTSSDTADIHCANCGSNAPLVELTKDR